MDPEKTQWHFNYVLHATEATDPESVIGKEFRAKFRGPYSMFELILQATRNSGIFPDELIVKEGQKPHAPAWDEGHGRTQEVRSAPVVAATSPVALK